MYVQSGKSMRVNLENERYLDVSYYENKWSTMVRMSLWQKDNPSALATEDKNHFHFQKIFSIKKAEQILKGRLNKQSQQVAQINLIP